MENSQHIRFVGSDDEDQPMHGDLAAPSAAVPAAAVGPTVSMNCIATINTDYDTKDQCYVLQLVHIPAAALVAATLSNRRVKLFALR